MESKVLIPKLRFSDENRNQYPDWEEKKLGEICKFFSGGTPLSSNKKYYLGEIPFIGSGNISDEEVNQYINIDALNSSSAKMINKGDILYALYGATSGEVAISKIKGAINQAVLCIRTSQSELFLFQLLKNEKSRIITKFLQGGQGNLSTKIIKELKFYFPNNIEQQKIASFLTTVDRRISLLEKKKHTLEQYKKGVMQKLFSQQLRFKDENGNPYPDWEEKKLGEVGMTFNGLTGKTKEDFGSGKPFIQYKQIFDSSRIKINDFGFVEITKDDRQTLVKKGDVFFTTSSETPNEIGYSSVLLKEIQELYLNSFCFGYRINDHHLLSPEYSEFLFRSPIFRRDIRKLAQGSTRYNMSKIELLKLKVKLPCHTEQQKIANFLSSIDKKIDHTNNLIEKSREFKKGLLQRMFV